jgi:hypothetical protein
MQIIKEEAEGKNPEETETRKKTAKTLFSHMRGERKKLSKIFQYFTGDEVDEFENDIPYDVLAEFSESELPDMELYATTSGKNRSQSNKQVENILNKVGKLGQAFGDINQNLRQNMKAANNHVRDVQHAGVKPIARQQPAIKPLVPFIKSITEIKVPLPG